jgi:hypothetical protein
MTAAWFAVGVCSCALLAACGGAPGQRSFTSAKEGVAISYPSIWKLTTRNDNYVPDPALCFDLVPKGSSRVDLRGDEPRLTRKSRGLRQFGNVSRALPPTALADALRFGSGLKKQSCARRVRRS